LDPQKRKLWRDGETVPLTSKATEVLLALVERGGEVVSKDELMEALWPDSFVEEANLARHVFMLRHALGETAEDRNLIATVPGRGYRFAGNVRKIANGNGASGPTTLAAEPLPTPAFGQRVVSLKRWLWLAVAALLLITSAIYLGWHLRRPRQQVAARRIVLAVLPFANLTGDATQDYFSDGLTEEMITQLGRLDPEHMGVIARASVMHYKNGQEQVQNIARELGVDYVLEGSVRRESGKVRITAQLIQTRDQTHVWAREYDRELASLLALQGEIAQEVVDEIQLTLGEHKRVETLHQPASESFEAYDLYLKGRYFWNKRTARGFEQAINYFQQAIAKEPTYARAYAGLADSYALTSSYGLVPANKLMPEARTAALKALQLDESLAEAHTSLALVAENYDWDWQTAEKEYRRAIQLDSNYATAHHWYAEYLAFQGRFDQALAESERARRLDPLSLIIAVDHGAILYFSRQYELAIEQFRTVLDMDPTFGRAHLIVNAYVQTGRFSDALADIDRWRKVENGPWPSAWEASIYGREGQPARAQEALRKMQEMNRRSRIDPAMMLAVAYVGMGKKGEALAALETCYREHCYALTALKVDPIYDPLRSDPRFQDLMRRVGLHQ
jgi:TolB-like protein/DNA-binding winged helix-turn-helix (wHTH) protein